MAGENCISDDLIALYMPNQGTKGKITALTSHFLPCPLLFPSASFSSFRLPCHLLFLPPPVRSLSFLASPAPPFSIPLFTPLSSPNGRICLLILIPHTKGGWIISFLSHPA